MHFHWRGDPKPVGEIAREVVALGAHAVEIAHPDEETNLKLIREVKAAVPGLPVILGGYTKHENAARRLAEADGAFVGTCFEDQWGGSILEEPGARVHGDRAQSAFEDVGNGSGFFY